ncbi:MAG: tetratricopeptide repeat protein [Saprospiraceae bacterium]|nr:tetratricopeptide repeat protein [Saprospiraceae bacterium]
MERFLNNGKWHQIILVLLSVLLYVNTLDHDFILDDNIVLKKNEFVKKGFQGIGDILNNDSFKGFFVNDNSGVSVSGGRYRPFTLVVFSSLYPVFGLNPMYYHLLNVIMYSLLSWMIYRFLVYALFKKFESIARPVSFIVGLLFVAHPIHTEVVNNVKSLDEIISLLFGILGMHLILKYVDFLKIKFLILSFISYSIAIFSKESAINFLYLTPLILFFFRSVSWKQIFISNAPALASFLCYGLARMAVIGTKIYDDVSRDVLTNPFMKIRGLSLTEASWSEKMGMIFASIGKYIKLFFIPYPLTHDYFPQHASLQQLGSPTSAIPFILLIAFLIYSYVIKKSRPVLSFGILLTLLPLVLVSNLVVPMGVPMAERFAFTASLGFSLVLGYLMYSILKNKLNILFSSLLLIIGLYSYVTIERNPDWKNEYSLFSTDVEISKNSIKAHTELAYHLVEKIKSSPDSVANDLLIAEAIPHLERTVQLYPRHANALFLLGNLHYLRKDYEKAANAYDKYLDLNPNGSDVLRNLQICYREFGRSIALKESEEEIDKAIDILIKSFKIKPNDPRLLESLGMAYGVKKEYLLSIDYFNKAIQLDPTNGMLLVNIGNTYYKMGDKTTGSKYIKEAYKLDKGLGAKLLNMQKPIVQ